MARKISTVVDEHLFRRVKLEAVRQGRPIRDVVGDALEQYLGGERDRRETNGVVARSWGALKIGRRQLGRVMAESDVLDV
ncbi:MAG: hypothetical protein ACRD3C_11745 [Vicinamibacterales bacterium]